MSQLDEVLRPIFDSAEAGNKFWHEDTEIEYTQQIKALMLELVDESVHDATN